jgi:hypothetical protein
LGNYLDILAWGACPKQIEPICESMSESPKNFDPPPFWAIESHGYVERHPLDQQIGSANRILLGKYGDGSVLEFHEV